MTTNLAECMNFVLKGARSLPIYALVNFFLGKKQKMVYGTRDKY